MATALEAGRVQAAFLAEPFLTRAERTLGVRTLFDPASGPTATLPMDGYLVTREYAEANPNTIRAFRTALVDAQTRASDRAVLEPLLVEATGVEPEIAALISPSAYPTESDPAGIQRVADLMLRFDTIQQPVDVSQIVVLD